MRSITLHTDAVPLTISPAQQQRLDGFISTEITDALAARKRLESLWRTLLRQYDAVPVTPMRNTPIENASNTEIPLGAIATDSIYAQMIDLIYTINQPITVRERSKEYVQRAKAMQRWVNFLITDIDMRRASEHAIFDTCQLGTGFYYIPFVESYVKHKAFKMVKRGPKMLSMLPEDVIMSGGVFDDLQLAQLVALRFYYTQNDIEMYAKHKGWDIADAKPCGTGEWVRQRREALSRTMTDIQRKSDIYEIYHVYVRFDVDEDGIDEDLLCLYDWTALKSLKTTYSPTDERPVEKMCYQIRSHMPYGQGVMEMLSPMQVITTALSNHQVDNVFLANCRMFKSKYGATKSGTISIWPGRNLEMADPQDLDVLQLADVYPSLQQTMQIYSSLSERRVGANELTQPNQGQTFGNRTPATTATSLLQQANRRFTPAFDAVRLGTAGAVRQAILRVAERIRAGDLEYEQHLVRLLSQDIAEQVIDCLRDPNFDQSIGIELTASSQSINKDADRQNAMMLANLLAPYYEKMMMLVQAVVNPMTPPEVRTTALKICAATSELVDRTIRTFDQFRDPESFIVDPSAEIEQAADKAALQEEMQLAMMLASSGGMMPGMGGEQQPMNGEGAPPDQGGQPPPPQM